MTELLLFVNCFFEATSLYLVLLILDKSNILNAKRLILFLFLLSIIPFIIGVVNLPYHMIINLVSTIILLKILLQKRFLDVIINVINASVVISIVQAIMIIISSLINISLHINENNYTIIVSFLIALLFLILYKYSHINSLLKGLYLPNKGTICLGAISIILIFILFTDLWDDYNDFFLNKGLLITVITLGYLTINILLIISLIKLRKEKNINNLFAEYEGFLKNVTTELRKKAHDYNSHLNTILSLVDDEPAVAVEEIKKYIELITSVKGVKISTALITENRLISAHLAYFEKISTALDIDFKYAAEKPMPSYNIHDYDLVGILSNLITNAIEEVSTSDLNEKKVSIYFERNNIIVSNTITYQFDDGQISQFKDVGFSTKGADRGLGLSVVYEIAKRNNIAVKTYTDECNIYFSLIFVGCDTTKMEEQE